MESFWIIGAGRFGIMALERLSKLKRKRRFVLVDTETEAAGGMTGPLCEIVKMDGVRFLHDHLHEGNEPDWVIPALPVHLAAEWAFLRLGADRVQRADIPRELEPDVPHPMRGESGDLYVSHADFICPDDCAEPGNICTVTQKSRPQNMFELLKEVAVPGWTSLVIRSRQLGAGMGGYRPAQLYQLLDEIKESRGKMFISTACRCHGVVSGAVVTKQPA